MSDWNGDELTIAHHAASKGRVCATANAALHAEALAVLRDCGEAAGAKRARSERQE
jgi:hypothetical protein